LEDYKQGALSEVYSLEIVYDMMTREQLEVMLDGQLGGDV